MQVKSSVLKKLDEKLNQEHVIVSDKDIDSHGQVCCPPQAATLWDMHPRVYLPVKYEKISVCPYCCAIYQYKINK